jgi:hypothetical protein
MALSQRPVSDTIAPESRACADGVPIGWRPSSSRLIHRGLRPVSDTSLLGSRLCDDCVKHSLTGLVELGSDPGLWRHVSTGRGQTLAFGVTSRGAGVRPWPLASRLEGLGSDPGLWRHVSEPAVSSQVTGTVPWTCGIQSGPRDSPLDRPPSAASQGQSLGPAALSRVPGTVPWTCRLQPRPRDSPLDMRGSAASRSPQLPRFPANCGSYIIVTAV